MRKGWQAALLEQLFEFFILFMIHLKLWEQILFLVLTVVEFQSHFVSFCLTLETPSTHDE